MKGAVAEAPMQVSAPNQVAKMEPKDSNPPICPPATMKSLVFLTFRLAQ